MPDISSIVSMTIDRRTATPSRPSLQLPLIVGVHSRFPERVRTYTALSDMKTDGFLVTDPEYVAASAIKAQDPSIKKWKVGRRGDAYIDSCTLQLTDQATSVGEKLAFTVDGKAVAYTVTSTSKATTAAALSAAIAAADTACSSTSVTDTITVTRAAGGFTRVQGWQRRLLKYKNTSTVVTTVGAELDSIKLEDPDFYGVLPAQQSKDDINQFAAWAETNKKLHGFTNSNDENVATTTNDVFSALKGLAYDKSFGIQNANDTHSYAAAAWMGLLFAKFRPGQATWNYKTLKGVSTDALNGSETSALEKKNANYYSGVAGLSLTLGDSKVASGEYIDIIYGLDWLEQEMALQVFTAIATLPKVPYTDAGLDIIRNAMLGVLKRAASKEIGLLVEGTYFVEMPVVSGVDPITKKARLLDGANFFGELAGAVHKANLQGTVVL